MDVTTIALTSVITTCVSGVVGALVASLVMAAKSKGKETIDGSRAMQDGMRALLWRELKDIHAEAVEKGGLTIEERRHLESVYAPYHGLGGNGTGTRLYEEAMAKDVVE